MESKRILAPLVVLALGLGVSGCTRTGIRETARGVNMQGRSTVDYSTSQEGVEFNYFTSENSSFNAQGVQLGIDPESGKVRSAVVESITMVRSPSDNQQYFAQQLAQGRSADTEFMQQVGGIVGAAVEGAVKAATEAFLPAYVSRQDNKTERRQISADRDVELATVHAETAMHHAEMGAAAEGGAE